VGAWVVSLSGWVPRVASVLNRRAAPSLVLRGCPTPLQTHTELGLGWRAHVDRALTARSCFRLGILFLKLVQRVYAPLSAAVLEPLLHDTRLSDDRRSELDHLYAAVDRALDGLLDHLGLRRVA
jgi:hypothetical protein